MIASAKGIRWLGSLIHPPCHRERFTIVLKAYLDGSGKRNVDRVATIAGFVSNEEGWAAFEIEWQAFLDEFEIERFHSAAYWSRGRPFNRWSEAKWLSAQPAICKAISSVQLLGVGLALDTDLFRKWRMTLDQYYPNDPYYFCLDRVLYRLITGISEAPKDEGVTIYIDRDEEYEKIGESIAEWHMDRLKYDPTVGTHRIGPNRSVDTHYGSSVKLKALQLADILSHASFQKLRNKLDGGSDPGPGDIFVDAMKRAKYGLQVYEYFDLWHLQLDLQTRFKNKEAISRFPKP